ALGIIMVTALVLIQPAMQTSYAQVIYEGAPAFESCEFELDEQADDPLSMNTIKNGEIAKTIISEKELFDCETVQGGVELVVHVNTIAEILENMTSKEIISQQALVITCAKIEADDEALGSADGTVLGCDWYRPGTDFIPVSDCDDITGDDDYLEHPNEMNTVNKGKTVKTIVIQKEVIQCFFNNTGIDDDKKVEQYIIEVIWEDLRLAPGDTVVKLNTESIRCTTLITDAFVESCQFRTVPLQEFIPEE
ncbi:MAG: hypothetical protein ACRD38_07520, partial [Nitrososphaerales archaeon]